MKTYLLRTITVTLAVGAIVSCKKPQTETAEDDLSNEKIALNSTTTITINANNVGNTVDSTMFGGVFEGHRLDLSSSNVSNAIELLHPTFLRNPGGTYAVCGYHYRDSEDGVGDPVNGVSSFDTEPEVATRHTYFLDFCQSHNIIPQLIIPSDRYSDASGQGLAAGRAYAKNFLTDINITPDASHPDPNHHGHQKVKYWNLGNEDYPASIDFNYGNMAKNYANDLVALDNSIKPTVNWKWNIPADAEALANTLGTATYRGIFTNVLQPNEDYSENDILTNIQEGVNKFPAGKRDLQIGAWQVASDPTWAWMRSATIFNRRFATFVRAGATIACYWPVLSSNEDRQARLVNGGSSPSLAPCGQLFKWLYTSASGKKIVEGITTTNADGVQVTAYRNFQSTTLVVFVCGNNAATNTDVEIDVSNFNVQSASGDRMSEGTQVGTGSQAYSEPSVTSITPTVNTSAKKISFKINKNTKWEIARIIIKTT